MDATKWISNKSLFGVVECAIRGGASAAESVVREGNEFSTVVRLDIPGKGLLRFIEVKGRAAGATTVTITKNEILTP